MYSTYVLIKYVSRALADCIATLFIMCVHLSKNRPPSIEHEVYTAHICRMFSSIFIYCPLQDVIIHLYKSSWVEITLETRSLHRNNNCLVHIPNQMETWKRKLFSQYKTFIHFSKLHLVSYAFDVILKYIRNVFF